MNNREYILNLAAEVYETRDKEKAASLLATKKWVAVHAANTGDDITWVLVLIDD